jgi:hypothetical protein
MSHPPPPRREPPLIVGWKEYVALPEWGIGRLKAKIDTGARSCALHAEHIEPLPAVGTGPERLRLGLSLSRRRPDELLWVEAPVVRYKAVKNTSGARQLRPFVRMRIALGGREIETELGIANRERMLFRLILGRKFLEGTFLVDVGRRYACGRPASGTRS